VARAQGSYVKAAPRGMGDGARIGRLAHVIVVGSGGIDLQPVEQAHRPGAGNEHALGGGRAADIAGANEQYADHFLSLALSLYDSAKQQWEGPMPRTSTALDTIVVLTGAGISKESGIDTFRDKDGLWS
jgi:hypothetical protein